MNLPSDPNMLLSIVNMKMRDGNFESLTDFCQSLDIDKQELIEKLSTIGYEWNPSLKQFR